MAEGRVFTREELAAYNGENGRPAYVAYRGRVIDVSTSRMWRGGMHMRRHPAGRDLTAEISAAPHDVDVLDRFQQVGVLAEEPAAAAREAAAVRTPAAPLTPAHAAPGLARLPASRPPSGSVSPTLPAFVDRFLDRHPFFQRHPHPMTVHFPIVFFIAAPVFTVLFLLTGIGGFDLTALNCLGAALLFSLVVIPTGLFTWWVNYGARPMKAITIKLTLSIVQFLFGLAAFVWRLRDPSVLRGPATGGFLYLGLVFLLLPMVVVVAWYGTTLTFPLRTKKRSWRLRGD